MLGYPPTFVLLHGSILHDFFNLLGPPHEYYIYCLDTSRFGVMINGERMASDSVRYLQSGDSLKLASKIHARYPGMIALYVYMQHQQVSLIQGCQG